MKNSKQFEKVFVVLLAAKGNEVTKAELEETLGSTVELYRISTYIWNIKKKLGGDVKVVKTGKQVTGYILKNFEKFKNFNVAPVAPVAVPNKVVAPRPKVQRAKAAMSKNEARAAAPVEAPPPVKIGEVPSYTVDGEFDAFDINDVVGAL